MSPYNPWNELPAKSDDTAAADDDDDAIATPHQHNHFFLIGMDQRFANRSTGAIQKGDGWHTFLQDQIALLDCLEIQKCHLLGSCIGPSYAFQLMKHAPERFGRCVMLQPIGLTKRTTEPGESWEGLNTDASWRWFGDWANEMIETQKSSDLQLLRQLHDNMFLHDFVFSVTRQEAARIQHPLLVFMGKDIFHPSETSRQIARIAPRTELVQVWRDAGPEKLAEAARKIEAFLLSD
jgi:pimeloyl-ACP methyl ester carboxylesterase